MNPRRIVLTGASSGIGAALARAYAAPGRAMLLVARDGPRLDAVRDMAINAGAEVVTARIDVTDRDAFAQALCDFDDMDGVDLMILAAGVKTGNSAGIEPPEQFDRVVAVNLSATAHAIQVILPRMAVRGRGQIAVFSSLAARSPHADLLSYSATKAGLDAYAVALRRALAGTGVTIHSILPGFVDTPMTDRHLGRTPMKVSADEAARLIKRELIRGTFRIAFPKFLFAMVWLQNLLPPALADRIDRAYRAEIVPDADETSTRPREDQSQG